MAMLIVDGVEIREPSEFTWGLNDVDASDSGRTQDGKMHRNRVTQKRKINLSWSMPTPDETSAILSAFNPQYFDVTYFDPLDNATMTRTFYASDKSAPVHVWQANKKYYTSVSFNIIER